MTDINITLTDCCLGAETIHTCKTLSEAVRWAINLLEDDRAVPVKITLNDAVLWDCAVNDEDKLDVLLNTLEVDNVSIS